MSWLGAAANVGCECIYELHVEVPPHNGFNLIIPLSRKRPSQAHAHCAHCQFWMLQQQPTSLKTWVEKNMTALMPPNCCRTNSRTPIWTLLMPSSCAELCFTAGPLLALPTTEPSCSTDGSHTPDKSHSGLCSQQRRRHLLCIAACRRLL